MGTPVTFTAAGQGSSGYQYQFWLNSGSGWTMVQDYGVGSSWTMPGSTPVGSHQIEVHVRTTSTVSFDAWTLLSYQIVATATTPATGVTVTPSASSPHVAGTPVTFTAAGQGSSGYQYQFWLNSGSGWTMVQDYGVGSSWTMPGSTPVGSYRIEVHVRTSTAVALDAWTLLSYQIVATAAIPATGVTVTPSASSPHVAGTPVTFTAAGQGSSGYQYQFWLNNGSGWTMVQDYGVGSSWTMPGSTPVGSYRIEVHVRTSTAVALDAWTLLSYQII
jgi:hypothetical protein